MFTPNGVWLRVYGATADQALNQARMYFPAMRKVYPTLFETEPYIDHPNCYETSGKHYHGTVPGYDYPDIRRQYKKQFGRPLPRYSLY